MAEKGITNIERGEDRINPVVLDWNNRTHMV